VTDFQLTGGCNCGAVRFEVTGPLVIASYCHCRRCQRRSGAAASANAHPSPDTFRIVAGDDRLRVWKPDAGGEKWFCGDCGSSLFGRNPAHADPIGVRMGAFDGDPRIRPSVRQFVTYAAPWEPIPDDGLPCYPESSGHLASLTRAAGPWWPLGAMGALTACALAVAAAERTDAHQPEFRPLRTITARLDHVVRPSETVLLTQRGFAALPLEPLISYWLQRRGVHVVGYHRPYDLQVEVAEAQQPTITQATVLARVTLEAAPWLPGADASRVITVSAARPGRR
jgi:hypothetical protein